MKAYQTPKSKVINIEDGHLICASNMKRSSFHDEEDYTDDNDQLTNDPYNNTGMWDSMW